MQGSQERRIPSCCYALQMKPFRRPHPIGEIILYPVSTTSLVRYRAGAGEPLVLLHGVGESAVGWHPVQEALSRHYDVIALDLPGFGGSARLSADARPMPRVWPTRSNASWTSSG